MSHADDGTLHAYLDGQLSPVERGQVEAHLASCPACQARVDEERALIERADALLGLATPPERAIPPFHQLRQARPLWRFRLPAVWAATVLLALGLGWYLGGTGRGRTPATPINVVTATRAETGATNALALQPTQPAREERQPRAATPATNPSRGRADEHAVEQARADSLATPAPLQVAPAVVRAEPPAELKAAPSTPAATAPTVMDGIVVTGQAARPLPARGYVGLTTSWTIIPIDAARSTLGVKAVTIPGLPVRDVRRSPLGDGVILVEQAVDQATVVQLFQRRANQPEDGPRRSVAVADSIAARDYAAAAKQPQGAWKRGFIIPSHFLS